jgi:diguanylate cyclase (GGDEF)-like protein
LSDPFIALLNPAIVLVFSAAFVTLWLYQRQRPYLLLLAAGYALSAGGFLLQQFTLPVGFGLSKLASNGCFALGTVLISVAIIVRHGMKVPYVALGLLAGGGLGAFSWFMFVEPDLTWRIFAMHFALGGICLLVAAALRALRHKTLADQVLLLLALVSGLNFFARPILVVWLHGPFESYAGFYESLFWTTAILSHAVLSLLIALSLITLAVLDVIRDLKTESHLDPLSGLLNRRGFEARAAALLNLCATAKLPVSLVVADLDHFKRFNDQLGHAAGDRVIVEFATRLKTAAGARGVAGRLGGEEFAILLPLTDIAAARTLAEAVRAVFAAGTIEGVPNDIQTTASFGVAARSGDEAFAALFARADEALYRAKKSGRDGVRISYERQAEALLPAALPLPA